MPTPLSTYPKMDAQIVALLEAAGAPDPDDPDRPGGDFLMRYAAARIRELEAAARRLVDAEGAKWRAMRAGRGAGEAINAQRDALAALAALLPDAEGGGEDAVQ